MNFLPITGNSHTTDGSKITQRRTETREPRLASVARCNHVAAERVEPERRAGKRHPTTGISILTFKVYQGGATPAPPRLCALPPNLENGNQRVLQRFLIPQTDPLVSTRHLEQQPASMDPMIDSLLLAIESDILYTLGVIEKRLLSMHCGLPWWRGVISGGIRSSTYSNTVFRNTRVSSHTRIEAVCYETQYTCRFRFCALSAGNNLHAAPNQPTMKEGRRNLAPMIIGAPRFAGSGADYTG